MSNFALPVCKKCGQAIFEHKQQRCLDLWIHEQIFDDAIGFDHEKANSYGPCPTCNYDSLYSLVPFYTEHVASAWLVGERMRTRGWLVEVRIIPEQFLWRADEYNVASDRKALCAMQYMDVSTKAGAQLRMASPTVFADYEALAICRAGLTAHYAQAHFMEEDEWKKS